MSVEEKLKVLKFVDEHPGKSQSALARELNIAQPTLSKVIKQRVEIEERAACGFNSTKRNRQPKCELLEQGLESFFAACKAKNLKTLTYDMMIVKGKDLASRLVEAGLVQSDNVPGTDVAWKSLLQRFLKKRDVLSRVAHGESGDADTAAATNFFDKVWPDLFKTVDEDASRVYNMDETGLFWRALPSRTLAKVDERIKGSKVQKDRITFAVTVCMDGTTLPLHGIGTSRLPRAVAATHTTPAEVLQGRWTHNSKAWMNSEVFGEWLLDINSQFRRRNKKIVLLVDNCPAHKLDAVEARLDFVNVVFLPANTTSIMQPCDAGIIRNFKAGYRKLMLRKITHLVDDESVETVDTNTIKKSVNMLHCLQYSRDAWAAVTTDAVKNCWRKAGFGSDAAQQAVEAGDSVEEDDLEAELQELEELDNSEPVSMLPSDDPAEIVSMMQQERCDATEEEDDDESDAALPDPPTSSELYAAIEVLRRSLYCNHADQSVHQHVTKLETFILKSTAARARQVTLDSFFQKE